MNKTYRIILLLLSFLMVAPFSGCAANHKVSTSNVLKTTIAQSSSVNVEITQQELKTEKQIFLNKVERLENSKDVTKMEVEIGEDQIRVTDQSIIQKWIRYLARLELQEVTEDHMTTGVSYQIRFYDKGEEVYMGRFMTTIVYAVSGSYKSNRAILKVKNYKEVYEEREALEKELDIDKRQLKVLESIGGWQHTR